MMDRVTGAAAVDLRNETGRPALDKKLLREAWAVRRRNFPMEIGFDVPVRTLPVSVTGNVCVLDCAHCGGHYLSGMVSLPRAVKGLHMPQVRSFLVSGGCDAAGKVPVLPFIDKIRELKKAGRLNMHVGLAGEDEAKSLAGLADVISFDLLGNEATIREVTGLDKTPEDYLRAYALLRKYARVVPHICIGLRGGMVSGEWKALRALKSIGTEAIVFLVFRPTRGTRFTDRRPPPVKEVVELIARARIEFPRTPIFLGCMRPGGRYREVLDPLAVRAGVNKVVQPGRGAFETASMLGLKIVRGEECCVL
ncbi:hypothetical protein ACUM6F_00850 [Desulforudis sp. DRI-14]